MDCHPDKHCRPGHGQMVANAGGVGTYVPGLILILLGVYGAMTAPPANEFSVATLKPDLNNVPALNPCWLRSRSRSRGSSWPRRWVTRSKIHGAICLARSSSPRR